MPGQHKNPNNQGEGEAFEMRPLRNMPPADQRDQEEPRRALVARSLKDITYPSLTEKPSTVLRESHDLWLKERYASVVESKVPFDPSDEALVAFVAAYEGKWEFLKHLLQKKEVHINSIAVVNEAGHEISAPQRFIDMIPIELREFSRGNLPEAEALSSEDSQRLSKAKELRETLLNQEVSVKYVCTDTGNTLGHFAALGGRFDIIRRLLSVSGFDPGHKNYQGKTLWEMPILGERGNTLLHDAVFRIAQDPSDFNFLLEKAIRYCPSMMRLYNFPTSPTDQPQRPYEMDCSGGNGASPTLLLYHLAEKGDFEKLKAAIRVGADPYEQGSHQSPLLASIEDPVERAKVMQTIQEVVVPSWITTRWPSDLNKLSFLEDCGRKKKNSIFLQDWVSRLIQSVLDVTRRQIKLKNIKDKPEASETGVLLDSAQLTAAEDFLLAAHRGVREGDVFVVTTAVYNYLMQPRSFWARWVFRAPPLRRALKKEWKPTEKIRKGQQQELIKKTRDTCLIKRTAKLADADAQWAVDIPAQRERLNQMRASFAAEAAAYPDSLGGKRAKDRREKEVEDEVKTALAHQKNEYETALNDAQDQIGKLREELNRADAEKQAELGVLKQKLTDLENENQDKKADLALLQQRLIDLENEQNQRIEEAVRQAVSAVRAEEAEKNQQLTLELGIAKNEIKLLKKNEKENGRKSKLEREKLQSELDTMRLENKEQKEEFAAFKLEQEKKQDGMMDLFLSELAALKARLPEEKAGPQSNQKDTAGVSHEPTRSDTQAPPARSFPAETESLVSSTDEEASAAVGTSDKVASTSFFSSKVKDGVARASEQAARARDAVKARLTRHSPQQDDASIQALGDPVRVTLGNATSSQ